MATKQQQDSAQAVRDILEQRQQQAQRLEKQATPPRAKKDTAAPGLDALATPAPKTVRAQEAPAVDVVVLAKKDTGYTGTDPQEALNALLEQVLKEHLPALEREGAEARDSLLALRRDMGRTALVAAWREVQDVADLLTAVVAQFVDTHARFLSELDALALAQVLARFLLRKYVQPAVPALAYWALERAAVAAVEWVWTTRVRRAPLTLPD